ncbi:MAG TPA: MnhB domain-containing protein [Thermomicrobiales bacterium]|jgi:multisubunit Na+/H+ antiporter MnhB subunit|nr:MnhB domain-containing protein [Thermomicrobiales bacterium]
MTIRETLRQGLPAETAGTVPEVPARPIRIWGTDGRLDEHHAVRPERADAPVTTTITQTVARVLLPITVMIAVSTLIKGYTDTGDGFSAGVILALGVIIQVACFGIGVIDRIPLLRYAPVAAFIGLLLALAVAFIPVMFGQPVLTHWPPPDASVIHLGTLEIITAVAFDVAVCLLVFGFILGTMVLLARTASVAAISQAQAGQGQRPTADLLTVRDHRPPDRPATRRETEIDKRPDEAVERGEVTSR